MSPVLTGALRLEPRPTDVESVQVGDCQWETSGRMPMGDETSKREHASARACANMYTLTRTDTSGLHLLPLCLHLLPSLYTSVYNNMHGNTNKQTYARTSKLYTNVYVYTSLTTRTVQLCMFMCAPLLGETLVACCVSTSWHKIQWQKRGKVWLLVKLQREEALAQD